MPELRSKKFNDAGLSTGKETVSYTVVAADTLTTIATALTSAINADTNLQAIGVTATSSSTVVNIKSASTNATTYAPAISSGATETLTLATGTGVSQYRNNELNQLINISAGGQVNVQAVTNKPVKSASVNGQVVSIASTPPVSPYLATYALSSTNGDFGAQFLLNNFLRGAAQFYDGGFNAGPSTVGTVYSVKVSHPALPNGQKTVSYTTVLGDTYATVASGISNAFNADTNIQSIGLSSTAASQTVTATPTFPTYTGSTSGGATETLTTGQTYEGQGSIIVGGTVRTGDVLSIVVHYPALTGLQETVSYTVLASDTLASIATALAAALNADTHLQAIDLTSSSASATVLTSSKSFTANPTLPQGSSSLVVSAVDGGNTTKSNNYQISTKGAASQALVYDRNGNMTSDGTNSYLWDAENRLVQINYPGSSNYSQFTHDGSGNTVNIVETVGGTTTSTKQIVWANGAMQEARNSSGTVTSQYFGFGETIGGTNYYWSKDHLGSIRELTDSSSNIHAEYSFDSYGRVTEVQESPASDFRYAGYYFHNSSGLSFTRTRLYSAGVGRWINRDRIAERGGINLYGYVKNRPIRLVDPTGKACGGWGNDPYGGWGNGYGWGSDPSLGWGWTPGDGDGDGDDYEPQPPVGIVTKPTPIKTGGDSCETKCKKFQYNFARYSRCIDVCEQEGTPKWIDCNAHDHCEPRWGPPYSTPQWVECMHFCLFDH